MTSETKERDYELEKAMLDSRFKTVEEMLDWFLEQTGLEDFKEEVVEELKDQCDIDLTDKPSEYLTYCNKKTSLTEAIENVKKENAYDLCAYDYNLPFVSELCEVAEDKLYDEYTGWDDGDFAQYVAEELNKKYGIVQEHFAEIIVDDEQIPIDMDDEPCKFDSTESGKVFIDCLYERDLICDKYVGDYLDSSIATFDEIPSHTSLLDVLQNTDKVMNKIIERRIEDAVYYYTDILENRCRLSVGMIDVDIYSSSIKDADDVMDEMDEKIVKEFYGENTLREVKEYLEKAKEKDERIMVGYGVQHGIVEKE